jgi:Flp pilus assembly protein TadB
MTVVRYTLYFWNPPILTPEEEVEAGRQIVTTGGPEVWKKKAPYLPERERARAETSGARRLTMPQGILLIILLLSVLALIVVAGPRLWVPLGVTLGVACVTVLPLSLYTLVTARKRHHNWVDKMVANLPHAQKARRERDRPTPTVGLVP